MTTFVLCAISFWAGVAVAVAAVVAASRKGIKLPF